MHGLFLESWQYHPLGLLILVLLIAIALASLLPPLLKQRLARYMESRAFAFNSAYLAFVVLFLAFGTIRALVHLSQSLSAVSL